MGSVIPKQAEQAIQNEPVNDFLPWHLLRLLPQVSIYVSLSDEPQTIKQ